jgi:hypothetical protein
MVDVKTDKGHVGDPELRDRQSIIVALDVAHLTQ